MACRDKHVKCADCDTSVVSSDHPYVTSAAILGTLGIVLSPYVLTAVVLLLVFTGVPNLPAPLRGFLPAPFLEARFKHPLINVCRPQLENLRSLCVSDCRMC